MKSLVMYGFYLTLGLRLTYVKILYLIFLIILMEYVIEIKLIIYLSILLHYNIHDRQNATLIFIITITISKSDFNYGQPP
jgi:hypothetical protein